MSEIVDDHKNNNEVYKENICVIVVLFSIIYTFG